MLNNIMSKYFVAHRFRLKPNQEQKTVLESWSHTNRYLWNHFLSLNQTRYENEKKFIFYHEMATYIPELKKQNPFLKEPPAQSLQGICQRLEGAIKRKIKLFKGQDAGFPHFKSRKRGDMPSIYIPQQGTQIQWQKNKIKLPKIGWVSWIKHRPLAGKLVSTTTKYEGGHWWIVVLCETIKPVRPIGTDVVGIDLGLKDWVVTSDGEVFNLHPRLLEKEENVKKVQRKLSKKQKGSNNRTKQRKKLQVAHMKVRNARNDNAHQVSAAIAKQYSGVAIEDLNIKGMMKNRHLARRVAQVAWGQLVSYLDYKTNVKKCDRWFPSSQLCSKCGHRQKMPLNIRVYECSGCGFVINRDLNAAINIRNNTFGTKEIYVCGDTSTGDVGYHASRYVSLKQENVEADISRDIFGLDAHGSSARG